MKCKDGAIPEGINLVQIAVAESGACPMCGIYVHEFTRDQKEINTFFCPKCANQFRVYCLEPLALQYIVESFRPKSDQRCLSDQLPPEVSLEDTLKGRLLESLSRVESPDDLRTAYNVDYHNYRQHLEVTDSIEKPLSALEQTLEFIFKLHNPAKWKDYILSNLQAAQNLGEGVQGKAISLVAQGFICAFEKLCLGTRNSSFSHYIPLVCPGCGLSYRWRSYIVVLDTAFPLHESEDYLSSKCPRCGDEFKYCFSLTVIRPEQSEAVFYIEKLRGLPDAQGLAMISAFCLLNGIKFDKLKRVEYTDINDFRWHFHPKKDTPEWMRMHDNDFGQAQNVLRALGASYFNCSEYEQALKCYRLAAIFDPTCRENYQGIASACTALFRFEDALAALKKKMSITDREGRYFYPPANRYGYQVLDVPEWAKAPGVNDVTKRVLFRVLVSCLSEYLERHPQDSEMCAFLCGAYDFLGDEHSAFKAALKTSAVDPFGAWTDLAVMYVKKVNIVQFIRKYQ